MSKNRLPELAACIERLLNTTTGFTPQDVAKLSYLISFDIGKLSYLTSFCGPVVNGPYGLVPTDHPLGMAALQTLRDRWPEAECGLLVNTDKTPDLQALLDALDQPFVRQHLSESTINQLLEADWVVENHPAFYFSRMAQKARKNPKAKRRANKAAKAAARGAFVPSAVTLADQRVVLDYGLEEVRRDGSSSAWPGATHLEVRLHERLGVAPDQAARLAADLVQALNSCRPDRWRPQRHAGTARVLIPVPGYGLGFLWAYKNKLILRSWWPPGSETGVVSPLDGQCTEKLQLLFQAHGVAPRAQANPMTEPDFYSDALIAQRWGEMKGVLGLHHCRLDWGRGHYAHFDKPRGFAVTFNKGDPHHSQLLFTRKPMSADRFDAILRHELGHVADFAVLPGELDAFALELGVHLPPAYTHVERRADAIAELVWSTPIRYDHELVQSLRWGVRPRPAKLGM